MPKHSHVKVVVTTGDVEITYDIPSAKNFEMDVKYEEPEIKPLGRKLDTMTLESLTFTMKPLQDLSDKYMTITRRECNEVVL